MRLLTAILFLLPPVIQAIEPGTLQFTLGGRSFTTTNALGALEAKNGRVRIHIGVKDVTAKFMLVITADVAQGEEKKPMVLTTEDSSICLTLRTAQGSLAILPHQQLVRSTDSLYTQRVEVETDQLEEVPSSNYATQSDKHTNHHQEKKYRKKIKVEYQKVKPKWHGMSRKERFASGEGVIENGAFRNSYVILQINPVLSGGKVVTINGTFGGSGRFSTSISGAEQRPIQNGSFSVKVQNVP